MLPGSQVYGLWYLCKITLPPRGEDENIHLRFAIRISDTPILAHDVGRVFETVQWFRSHTNASCNCAGDDNEQYLRSIGARAAGSLAYENWLRRVRLAFCNKDISKAVIEWQFCNDKGHGLNPE
jgi:hypothetical protein